jgi:hypothetical protein
MLNRDAARFPQSLPRAFTHMVEKTHPGTFITKQTLPNVNPKRLCLKVTVPICFFYPCGTLKKFDRSAMNYVTSCYYNFKKFSLFFYHFAIVAQKLIILIAVVDLRPQKRLIT